ncbi:MAG: hypothetical protein QXH17_09430 [Candidatus Bathyarchaeia archaeon]
MKKQKADPKNFSNQRNWIEERRKKVGERGEELDLVGGLEKTCWPIRLPLLVRKASSYAGLNYEKVILT